MKKVLGVALLLYLLPLSVWAYTNLFSISVNYSGGNQYLSHARSTTLEPAQTITISAWVKWAAFANNSAPGQEPIVAYDHSGSVNKGYVLQNDQCCSGTNERLVALFNNDTLAAQWTPIDLVTGTWYNVVTSWNGSTGAVTLYVNGVSKGTSSVTGSFSYSGSGTLAIGSASGGGGSGSNFDGNINDVRIWGRELSSTEVTNLYNAGAGSCSFANGANLLGWWITDTNDGTDSSGNGLTLTNNGATFVSSVPYTCAAAAPSFNFWQFFDF